MARTGRGGGGGGGGEDRSADAPYSLPLGDLGGMRGGGVGGSRAGGPELEISGCVKNDKDLSPSRAALSQNPVSPNTVLCEDPGPAGRRKPVATEGRMGKADDILLVGISIS